MGKSPHASDANRQTDSDRDFFIVDKKLYAPCNLPSYPSPIMVDAGICGDIWDTWDIICCLCFAWWVGDDLAGIGYSVGLELGSRQVLRY